MKHFSSKNCKEIDHFEDLGMDKLLNYSGFHMNIT